MLRSAHFITAHYVSHFRRDCRGRFLNSQKICHGVQGYPGVLRLPIPFPCVASRLSRFDHGCLKCGCRDRREHSVNADKKIVGLLCSYLPQKIGPTQKNLWPCWGFFFFFFVVTAKLISAFVFATRIVQSLYFLNTKFHASSCLLCLYRSVCVVPVRKLHCWFSHKVAHIFLMS